MSIHAAPTNEHAVDEGDSNLQQLQHSELSLINVSDLALTLGDRHTYMHDQH